MTLWKELKARGFFFQCTNEEELQKTIEQDSITLYAGFDSTAASLHIGHFVPLLLLAHFGRRGHTPVVVTGGATAKVGDPSGKTAARPMLDAAALESNTRAVFAQAGHVMNVLDVKPLMLNNDDWLKNLKFIDFVRDIGVHFSVSRMLSFDTYKNRLEGGLSFLEFTYQLFQAYDYLHLHQVHNCILQVGGADQWANIIAGCDLIRRIHRAEVFGYTVPLITRSDGAKMGKTEGGAVYFDSDKTTPFDFYQYWRNISDADVCKFLKMYTFIPLEELERYKNITGRELNEAKELLAHTVTGMIHGSAVADEMRNAAHSMFSGGAKTGENRQDTGPSHELRPDEIEQGLLFVDLYVRCNLAVSKNEARRLIAQGGARIGDAAITDENQCLTAAHFANENPLLKFGKKKFIRLILKR